MSRAGRIARRGFLIGSAAVLGGVAFGAWRYGRPLPDPFMGDLPQGQSALNPYVLIDGEGVTLIAPRADKGQGSRWMQAALIAEELDIDPATARIEAGPVSAAYYNTSVLGESLPFRPTDRGWLAEAARGAVDVPSRLLGFQITGGSSSAPDSFEKLRLAGAVARETLKQAAALREGLDCKDLSTADGAVILPDGRAIPYTQLATEAAQIDPIDQVVLRDKSQWRWLGRKMRRGDIVAKSTGTQIYGADLRLPDMLYASVRAVPQGGRITSLDSADAEQMRGVRRVLQIGEAVAVIAETSWHAMQALQAVDLQWAAPDTAGNQDQIWDSLTQALDQGDVDSRLRNDGDVEAALADGQPVTAEYRVPFLAHAPLEPMNATVRVDADRCEIWTGTQVPDFVVSHVADLTGLPQDAITLHNQMMGGSFGRRLELDFIMQAVRIAAEMPGQPIQMIWSRAEDFTHDQPRPAQIARGRGLADKTGIRALDLAVASPSVTASWFGRVWMAPPGPDNTITAGAWDQPFAIPDYRVTGHRAAETVPVSSWRSVGASANGFFHGSFMDELFDAAGIDPLQGLIDACDDRVSRLVLEELRELSGWTGRDLGPGRGRGVAFCLSFGVPCAEVVEVTETPQGIRLDRAFAVADIGTVLDPVNAEAQLSGGMLFGLGHAMNCELTYRDHMPQQTNYHAYQAMRLYQAPQVQVRLLENGPVRGLGEPGVPPAAPALANAIHAATGMRVRELPMTRQLRFA